MKVLLFICKCKIQNNRSVGLYFHLDFENDVQYLSFKYNYNMII